MTGVPNDLRNRTFCKCPKCGKEFYRWTTYTGRLPARYFCNDCARFSHGEAYATEFEDNTYGGNY